MIEYAVQNYFDIKLVRFGAKRCKILLRTEHRVYRFVNAASKEAQKYFCGKDGIVPRWLEAGASGWRLDVVDEIADCMLDKIVASAKNILKHDGELEQTYAPRVTVVVKLAMSLNLLGSVFQTCWIK